MSTPRSTQQVAGGSLAEHTTIQAASHRALLVASMGIHKYGQWHRQTAGMPPLRMEDVLLEKSKNENSEI